MKKSQSIQLVFLNTLVLGVVGCDDAPTSVDPCATRTFNPEACEVAVHDGGYRYHGAWIPLIYPSPYLFYAGRHSNFLARGGATYAAPLSAYQQTYRSLDARANAFATVVTPRGTMLSPRRMSAITSRPASIARARSGATVRRGGFGTIGAGRSSIGG